MSKKENESEKKVTKTRSNKNAKNNNATKKTTTNKPKSRTQTKNATSNKKSNVSKRDTNIKKDTKKVVKSETQEEVKLEKTPIVVEEVKLEKVKDIKEEKDLVEEVSNINGAKIENAKFTVRKKNKLPIAIGTFISLLGIIALIISIIANRIVDREFISDAEIIVMVIVSIFIEIMGSIIIIKET